MLLLDEVAKRLGSHVIWKRLSKVKADQKKIDVGSDFDIYDATWLHYLAISYCSSFASLGEFFLLPPLDLSRPLGK